MLLVAKRKEVKSMLKDAEIKFVRKKILECQGKPGAMWKIIRNYASTSRAATAMSQFTKDHRVVADEFNVYFTSVGQKTAETVTQLAMEHNVDMTITSIPSDTVSIEQFNFKLVTTLNLEKCIQKMPGNKSPGADKIPIKILKECLPNISAMMTDIINHSFAASTFPENWKLAEVVPHLKENDHEFASNNRPISLIQSTSKICERIALDQLMNYLDDNDLLTSHQSGNKNNHSTETLNIHVSDSILNGIDCKKITILVLLDLSKAFDSINHDLLLGKLERKGACVTISNSLVQELLIWHT